MNAIIYVSIPCGRGSHGKCDGEAFIEVSTALDGTNRETRRTLRCECPHHAGAKPE